jgi:hypothetical protein
MGPGGRIDYGSHSHSHWEDETVVATTHRFHAGHELVIEERMRLVDGSKLIYTHAVTGPDGTTDRRDIAFAAARE